MTHNCNIPLTSLTLQAKQLKTVSVNETQKQMIDNLRDMGLLTPPKFTLSYGPTSSTQNVR